MPGSPGELAWWAFNGVLLLLIGLVKADLSEIKTDGRKNRELQEQNARDIAQRAAVCEERHKRIDHDISRLKEN